MHINISFYFQWRTLICTLMFGACHGSSLISGNWHHLGSHQQEGLQSDCCHHQWPDLSHHWQQLKNSGDLRIYMLYILHPICVIPSFRSKIYWTVYMYVCICTCIYRLNILSQYTNLSWYDICGVVHVYNYIWDRGDFRAPWSCCFSNLLG